MITSGMNGSAAWTAAFALFASPAGHVIGQDAPARTAEADVDALARPFETLWQFDTGG